MSAKLQEIYDEIQRLVDERKEARDGARTPWHRSTRLVSPTCPIVLDILGDAMPNDWRPEQDSDVVSVRDRIFHRIQDRTNCPLREALEDSLKETWELVDALQIIADRVADMLPTTEASDPIAEAFAAFTESDYEEIIARQREASFGVSSCGAHFDPA